ncbi:MAG: Holliday junction resolvase RuvX [Pseudomonadota bacterium]|nr:Holliday junction resolvase RuvX [Pseudomonadota bacterium]
MPEAGPSNSGQRTLLGFDFGLKRIGVAVGQELTGTTRPLTTVNVNNQLIDWPHIERLLNEWQPDLIIVGLPLNMDGSEAEIGQRARRFSNQLHGRFNRPVALVDERLTSIEAEQIVTEARRHGQMKKQKAKESVDQIAAELILKSWLGQ